MSRYTSVELTCAHCHATFIRRPSRISVHCSSECRKASGHYKTNDNPPYYKSQQTDHRKINPPRRADSDETKTCPICSREFHAKKSAKRIYCSRHCAAKGNGSTKWANRKMPATTVLFGSFREKIKKQIRTSIEAKMEQCLQSLSVSYIWECRFGNYWVDFYLPDYNLAIECDGSYWHRNSEYDKKRDAVLTEKHRIRIKRFTDREINGNLQDLIVAALAS